MGLGKTYSTKYLVDSNNNTGAVGEVLVSTATGINWANGSDIVGGPYLPLAGGTMTGTAGIIFPDDFKLNIGAGSDLQIYHDGSDSFISDTGIGDLKIASSTILMLKPGFGEFLAKFIPDGAVELYYDAVKKFETTSTGVEVTGKITNLTAGTGNLDAVNVQQLNDATTGALIFQGTWSAASTTTGVHALGSGSTIIVLEDPNLGVSLGSTVTGTGIPAGTTVTTYYNSGAFGLSAAITMVNGAVATFTTVGGIPDLSRADQKVTGNYYICETAGVATPNGAGTTPDDWAVGDWVAFSDLATDAWQKIDNSSVLSGAGTGGTVPVWAGSGTSVTLGDSPITVSGNNATFAGTINSGAITSTGKITGTELEGTSLDINGNGDISGTLTVHNTLTVNKSQGTSALTINNAGNGGWTQYASTNDGVYGYIGSGSHLLAPVVNDNDFVLRAQGEFAVSIAATEKMRINSSGNATFTGDVVINSAGDAASPVLRLNNSSSGSFNHALEAINANLTATETELLLFGKAASSRNSGFIGYNWNADNSDTNYVTIGHWGYNHLLKIYPTGAATFVGAVTAPTFLGDLNGTINTATTGATQTAGNNSTLIATTAYADAAAAAGGGNFLPLSAGSGYPLTGALHTNGTIFMSAGNPGIIMQETDVTDKNWDIQVNGGNLLFYEVNDARSVFNQRVTLEAGGNVGIGTTDPNNILELYKTVDSAIGPILQLTNSQYANSNNSGSSIQFRGYTTWGPGSTNPRYSEINAINGGGSVPKRIEFKFYADTDVKTPLAILQTGNVGIGTTAPVSKLHIKTSVDNSVTQGLVIERSANSDRGYINYNGGGFQFRSTVGDPIVFGETDSEHMRILPDGNVGIGTTAPGEKLEVDGVIESPYLEYKPFVFYDFNSDTVGQWGVGNATLSTPSKSVTRFTTTGTDANLNRNFNGSGYNSPAIPGGQNQIIRIRYKWISGTAGSGEIFYTTAGHGYSGSYYKTYALNTDGNYHTLVLDMSDLTAGGTDWIDNDITAIRFDLTNITPVVIDIDWIAVGGNGWGTQYFENDVAFMNGDVGIGTTVPGAKLEVAGASGAISGTGMTYLNNSDDAFSLVIKNAGTSTQNDRGVFEARVGTSSVFRINNSGNVGIGITAPAYKLDVSGSARLGHGGDGSTPPQKTVIAGQSVEAPAGPFYGSYGFLELNATSNYTSGARRYAITNALDANKFAIIRSDSNMATMQMGVSGAVPAGAAADFVIDNTGKVGIGTTTPSTKLDVNGAITAGTANSTSGSVLMYGKYSNGHLATIGTEYSNGGLVLGYGVTPSTTAAGGFVSSSAATNLTRGAYSFAAGTHKWWSDPVSTTIAVGTTSPLNNTMTLLDTGNLGIGTTAPNGILQFANDAETRKIVLYEGANNDYQFYGFGVESSTLVYSTAFVDDDHVFFSGASATTRSELMRIEGEGNVGIGTASPDTTLHVQGATDPRIDLGEDTNNKVWMRWNSSGNYADFTTRVGGTYHANTLVVRDGNIGIKITAPTQRLHVSGNARVTGAYYDSNNSPGTAGQVLSSTVTGTDWVAAGGGGSTVYSPDIWEIVDSQTISNGTTIYRSEFNGKLVEGTTNTTAGDDDYKIKVVDAGVYEISYSATLQTTYSVRQVIAGYFELDDGVIAGSAMSNYLRTTGTNQGGVSSVSNSFYCTIAANQILRFAFRQIGPSNFTGMQNMAIIAPFSGMASTVSVRRIT